MARIGILGGTFDPIHIGHLLMAEEALEHLKLDRLMFVPNRIPPHKAAGEVTSHQDRYMMTVLGTMDHDNFQVSRVEIDRKGLSFTIDTVRAIRERLKEEPASSSSGEDDLFLVVGLDSLVEIETWKSPGDLVREVTFAVAPRLRYIRDDVPDEVLKETVFLPMPPIDISSTQIRERVALNRSIRYLVPSAVQIYIRKMKLYLPR